MDIPQPPQDTELRNIIDKLAQFVARNGPEFEQMTKSKQKGNPKFQFLYGGEYFNYYQYKVTTEQTVLRQQGVIPTPQNMNTQNQSWNQPQQNTPTPINNINNSASIEQIVQQQETLREQIRQSEQNLTAQHTVLLQQQQVQVEQAATKYDEESLERMAEESSIDLIELNLILQPIIDSCTKDSISNGKSWILTHGTDEKQTDCISQGLLLKVINGSVPFSQKLHIIYLVNDVLHHCARKHADELKNSLENVVVPMFCNASVGATDDQRNKLEKLLKLWESKANYLASTTVDKLRQPAASYQQYQAQQVAKYVSEVSPLIQQTKSTFDGYQAQHQAFVSHAMQQILTLQQQKQNLETQTAPQQPIIQPQNIPQQIIQQSTNITIENVNQNLVSTQNLNTSIANIPQPSLNPPNLMQQQSNLTLNGNNLSHINIPTTNMPPNNMTPSNMIPSNMVPSNMVPSNMVPSNMGPSNMALTNMTPSNMPPTNMPSTNNMPANNIPPNMQENYLPPINPSVPPPNLALPLSMGQPPNGLEHPIPYTQPPPVFLAGGFPDFSKPPPGFPIPEPPKILEEFVPTEPYYNLPAGLMIPLIKLEETAYRPLDPKAIRLPPPAPPSDRLIAAVEAFYAIPSHDRPRDSEGWEKLGLYEYYKAKNNAKRQKEDQIHLGLRQKSRTPSPVYLPLARSPSPPKRRYQSKSPSPLPAVVSIGPKRSRSRSRTPPRKRRSKSKRRRSDSRSQSRSPPPREMHLNRSPTPPSFMTSFIKSDNQELDESNKGHQMLRKMGWGGSGLGAKEQGIDAPISGGDVRDRQDQFKGVGMNLNDPYENFRKHKGAAFITRMKARAEERAQESKGFKNVSPVPE